MGYLNSRKPGSYSQMVFDRTRHNGTLSAGGVIYEVYRQVVLFTDATPVVDEGTSLRAGGTWGRPASHGRATGRRRVGTSGGRWSVERGDGRKRPRSLALRREFPGRGHRCVTAELRKLKRTVLRGQCRGASSCAGVGGGATAAAATVEHVGLAGRRETRVSVGRPDAERLDEPVARRLGRPGQQQVEHGPFPAEYEEHEHAAERVYRVRHVPVVRGYGHGP